MTLGIKGETQSSKLIIMCHIHILSVFQDIFKSLILPPSIVRLQIQKIIRNMHAVNGAVILTNFCFLAFFLSLYTRKCDSQSRSL